MKLRRLGAIAIAGLAASVLAACSASSGGDPGAAGATTAGTTITIYNGQHEETTNAVVSAFEAATGIKVNVRSNDEATLAQQIAQEGSRSPADVFFTENTPVLEKLQGSGLLAPVASTTLADVPGKYSSSQGDWVGVTARVSVIEYNTNDLTASQLPKSILDLADPKWKGKLAFSPGETDFQPIVTSIQKTYGTARTLTWLAGIKSNLNGATFDSNETVTSDVNSGQAAIGLINQYYWYRLKYQVGASGMHSAIAYFTNQDPGYVINVSGAAILKSSAHQAAAQKFLAFLVSKQGQSAIDHSDSFEYPIASGYATIQAETPFAQLQPNSITLADLGDGSNAVSLLQQAGLL